MSDSPKKSFLVNIAPYIYKYLMLLITSTCKLKVHGKEHIEAIHKDNKPWIYSIWHNNVLISPWALRKQNVTVMVSESKDGEIISRSVHLFGNTTVRGSTSRGSAKATRQALKTLKKNNPVAITPDGPRGPKYELQEGVLFLAAISKTAIIPFHSECSKQWEFNSWDKLKLPKPFSTIHLCFGPAIDIDRDTLDSNIDQLRQFVEERMMDNVQFAIQAARPQH